MTTLKHLTQSLTRRQKGILLAMILANIAIVAVVVLALRNNTPSGDYYAPAVMSREACGDLAARLLAQRSIGGTASIGPDNILRLDLTGPNSHESSFSQSSDVAWEAMTAMLMMPFMGCGPYPFVQVDIPFEAALPAASAEASATDAQAVAARLLVKVDWLDLRAWGYHELDDGELAGRIQTTLYTQPSIDTAVP